MINALLLTAATPAAAFQMRTAAPRGPMVRAAGPTMHCMLHPVFTINDFDAAKPLMDECVTATKAEAGCVYYGWTVSEDKTKLYCRETYVDGKAAMAHLEIAVPIVGKMLDSGCVALDSIGVMGTAEDMADVREEADKVGAEYWEVWDSFSNFEKADGEVAASANFIAIQPTFTLLDRAKAEPFMKACVEATKSEAGCVYYGWTICGDKLFCREAYIDGDAVNAHLANAVPIVGQMLDSGAATLDRIEFHGPKAEWGKFAEAAEGVGPAYFDVDASFAKFSL